MSAAPRFEQPVRIPEWRGRVGKFHGFTRSRRLGACANIWGPFGLITIPLDRVRLLCGTCTTRLDRTGHAPRACTTCDTLILHEQEMSS